MSKQTLPKMISMSECNELRAKGFRLYVCETLNGPGALTKREVFIDRQGYKWFKSAEKFVA